MASSKKSIISALINLVNRRAETDYREFAKHVFRFMHKFYWFDSGLYVHSGKLFFVDNKRIFQLKEHIGYFIHPKLVCDYVEYQKYDETLGYVSLSKMGAFTDHLENKLSVRFYASDLYDVCVQRDIGGDMLYAFIRRGFWFRSISLYRRKRNVKFNATELSQHRKLYRFFLNLLDHSLNRAFAVFLHDGISASSGKVIAMSGNFPEAVLPFIHQSLNNGNFQPPPSLRGHIYQAYPLFFDHLGEKCTVVEYIIEDQKDNLTEMPVLNSARKIEGGRSTREIIRLVHQGMENLLSCVPEHLTKPFVEQRNMEIDRQLTFICDSERKKQLLQIKSAIEDYKHW